MAKKPLKVPVEKYQNLSGKSTVVSYKIVKDSVTIVFTSHEKYIYSNQSAGRLNINQMKALAIAGKGLGTFIDTNLKEGYARKTR